MNKTLADLTSEELRERRRYHDAVIKLIDAELSKRGTTRININKNVSTTQASSKPNVAKPKSSNKKQFTRGDMMAVLDKKDIKYKKSDTKAELMDIVRKNNLVRTVEEYSQKNYN